MHNVFNRCLAFFLSATLLTAGLPANAVAEATAPAPSEGATSTEVDSQHEESTKTKLLVEYRVRHADDKAWSGKDDGWVSCDSSLLSASTGLTKGADDANTVKPAKDTEVTDEDAEEAPEDEEASTDEGSKDSTSDDQTESDADESDATSDDQTTSEGEDESNETNAEANTKTEAASDTNLPTALTSVALRTSDDATRIEYRLLDADGTWQKDWTSNGETSTIEKGIYGIETRLVDAKDAAGNDGEGIREDLAVWYRVRTSEGAWLDWTCNGKPAGSSSAPIVDMQVVLAAKDARPTTPVQPAFEGTLKEDATTAADENGTTEESSQEPSEEKSDEASDSVTDKEVADAASAENAVTLDTQAESDEQNADTGTDEVVLEGQAESEAPEPTGLGDGGDDANLEAQADAPSIEYQTHVQQIGWQNWVKNGAVAGTSGRSLRLEALRIRLKNASGSVVYSTHAQTYGWLGEVSNGADSGTTGESKRLEAVTIRLTGDIAQTYDVWYRAHVQTYGWQDWVKNGTIAGTEGQSKRVEALEILLVKKGDAVPTTSGSQYVPTPAPASPSLFYQTHVQTYGWQNEMSNGQTAGTSGESKRLEAMRISLRGASGGISYRTHVQTYGWQDWRNNGDLAGTSGESKRLEAFQVKLTGAVANDYDVWYRCHIQSVGWMDWAKNGESAGSEGYSLRMEAMQIKLLPKGSAAPSNFDSNTSAPFLSTPTVSYNAKLAKGGWQDERSNGVTAGATGVSARIQQIKAQLSTNIDGGLRYGVCSNGGSWQAWQSDGAVAGTTGQNVNALRMQLTGTAADLFDVWYRVHVARVGWLDWVKNAAITGSDGSSYPIEAFEVRIQRKNTAAPGSTANPFHYANQLNGVDISGWDQGINIAGTDAEFMIIKATEGVSTPGKPATRYNPWYETWANQVLNTGRLLGFYHYANGGDAVKEADEFYEAIKDFKGRAIACLDWEGDGNKLFNTGMDVAWCKKFLDRLKERYGGTPFIYTSKNYVNAYDWTSVANSYPLWGAEYPDYNDVLGYQSNPWQSSRGWGAWGSKPKIFQYTGTGVLVNNGGIDYFDFDLFYGDKSSWESYLR